MARDIHVLLTGDARDLERTFHRGARSTQTFEKALNRVGKAALYMGAAIVTGATVEVVKATKEALKAETAQRRLAQSFTAAHMAMRPYIAQIEKAEAAGRRLGFTDTNTKEALGSLITATHNYRKAATDLGVAQDVSRFKHVELVDATKMLTMAMTGSQRAAKQLGITVIPLTTNVTALKEAHKKLKTEVTANELAHAKLQDKMALGQRVIDAVREKVQGQARVFSETAAGGMERFRAQFEHLQVTIGKAFLPLIAAAADKLSVWIERLQTSKRFQDNFRATVAQIRPAFETAVTGVQKFSSALGEVRGAVGPDIFSGLIIGILGAGGALAAIVKLRTAMLALAAIGTSGGALGLAFVGLAVLIGAVSTAFIGSRREADNLKTAYDRVAGASRNLHDTELNLKQAELDVQKAMLQNRQSTEAVTTAQHAYAVAVREHGAGSAQARAALEALKGAQLDARQAALDLSRAQDRSKAAHREASAAIKAVTGDIVDAANKQRDAGHGFVANALTFGRSWHTAGRNAQDFADAMDRAAQSNERARPKVAAAQRAVANLAIALGKVPSDTQIKFIVRTISLAASASPGGTRAQQGQFGGRGGMAGGGFVPGARTPSDSVPAMLSPGEFVVTGGGERILESMTFPGVLNWLQGAQPRHFAAGGRAGSMTKRIEYDRLYQPPMGAGGASARGLVAQVLRALAFARGRGWRGSVISGWRSYSEQAALYARYLAGGNIAAPPGHSSHESGQAVDVSDASTFDVLMNQAPPGSVLYNNVPGDFSHFSVSGRRRGGRISRYAAGGRVHDTGGLARNLVHWSDAAQRYVLGYGSYQHGIPTVRMQRDWFNRWRGRGISTAQAHMVIPWWESEGYADQYQTRRMFGKMGHAAGGRVGGLPATPTSRGKVPPLLEGVPVLGPAPAPSPVAGLRRRIAKLRGEERRLRAQLARVEKQLSQLPHPKKPSKSQAAERKRLTAERERILARLKTVQAELAALGQRVQEAISHDYSMLPVDIQLEEAQAALTETPADDLAALQHAQSYLISQLRRPGITKAQRVQILQALAGVRSEMGSLQTSTDTGGGGDTGAAARGPTADEQAQMDQLTARANVATESARLANAFVATGVFGSSTGGIGGAGGTPTFNFGFLIPDASQLAKAVGAIAEGAGAQGYRTTSVQATGF